MTKMTERLADLASGVLLNTAQVTDVSQLSPRFVKVELQAEAFRTQTWTPGAKLQLRPRRGTLGLRTYTPTKWDNEHGTTQLIAFTHGEGPAAGWFRQVATSDACEIFGPRGSIDLRGLSERVVFVGDESSVGLACALSTVTPDVRHIFEAANPAELTDVLADLGFTETVTVVPKGDDRAQLIQKARDTAQESDTPFHLVLTGDAATVHTVRRSARQWPHSATSTKARAYWAEGRTGLD
jgi:NADPH-dependent ferric siderophore reductase